MSYGPAATTQPAPRPAPPRPPASSAYRKALRVATAIAIVKWFVIALALLATVALPVYMFATIGGSDYEDVAVLIAAGTVLAGLLVVLLVWVLFGWFEHMLRVLVAVADHTHR